jgi:glycosyltransferase involved in cell wall biosynthesis
MKHHSLSLITVVHNSAATIRHCIESVLAQNVSAEHIIIDGQSTDGTLDIINEYSSYVARIISEPDKGIYDAMNKGIALATGDVVGLLNADDMYANNTVLDSMLSSFADPGIDACYSDLVYVDRINTDKVIRYWKSCEYNTELFRKGWMPPHPTLYIRKSVYDRFGLFDLNFKIASDSELMLRFIGKHDIKTKYLPLVTIKMRVGGTTNKNLSNILKQNMEIYQAAKKNGISLSPFYLFYKLRDKVSQFYRQPLQSLWTTF